MITTTLRVLGAFFFLAPPVFSQATFMKNVADVPSSGPANNSNTNNIDFADVDLDGDWDAVFANGLGMSQEQNRIWINRGPGVDLGIFVDETATRFPAIQELSRDIDFVDFDGDSDPDIYVSNSSTATNQGPRWWRNTGAGHYVDETSTRWLGLGGVNSSLHPSLVLPTGSFIDFSEDADFADLDNDGDLDLFHSSFGASSGSHVPSRIFLNDGNGFFTEFNPSGFQLAGLEIQPGDPGLWCEGIQADETLNSIGAECDIASSSLDSDLGDLDGDFDLDVVQSVRGGSPRVFANTLEDGGGTLGFRDVTGAVLPASYTASINHSEQELGDLDGDGDLDLVGIAGSFSSGGVVLRNRGDALFDHTQTLAFATGNRTEVDCLDYDNDGDLDLLFSLASDFSGNELWNHYDGPNLLFGHKYFPLSPPSILDTDVCDVDGDGDYDAFSVNAGSFLENIYWENVTEVPDTHAPYLPALEQAPDRQPSLEPTVVRVHVYDNAPQYITTYNATRLIYDVDGLNPTTLPATYSGGQVFRAEIPGSLVGTVTYSFSSEDEYGNQAVSASRSYVSSNTTLNSGQAYCFGDGTGANCPCADGGLGEGCLNSSGRGAVLWGSGHGSFTSDSFVLSVQGATGNKPGLLVRGGNAVAAPAGDGILCTSTNTLRSQVMLTSSVGTVTFSNFQGQSFGNFAFANAPTNFQFYYRDIVGSCTGAGFNFSSAWTVTYLP